MFLISIKAGFALTITSRELVVEVDAKSQISGITATTTTMQKSSEEINEANTAMNAIKQFIIAG